MNTRRGILIIVSSVLLCMLIQRVQANPNHLEPIAPYHSFTDTGYHQAVFTSLIGKHLTCLWMIERPSFAKEYAVILWNDNEYDPNDTRPAERPEAKRRRWYIEQVAPKEKIWRWKTIDNVHFELDIKPTEDVERHRVYITEDLAKALQEAWLRTLQLTRYGENRTVGLDGTTLEFCSDGLFGQTWSPTTGLPAMLAGLGRKLSAVALSDEKNRDFLLAEAESLARKTAEEAEAEQIRLFGKKMSHITWSSIVDRAGRGSQTREAR
jgi:hypothetical protein